MKFKIQTLFALIFPFLSFAQDKGIDQIIDEKFGDATGWFVNFIFSTNNIDGCYYATKINKLKINGEIRCS